MKKGWIIVGIAAVFALSGCRKDVGRILTRGEWKISQYIDSGDDETNEFASYKFNFMDNQRVEARGNAGTFTGTWDENIKDLHDNFFLSFTNSPLSELSDDWVVVEKSRTEIRLSDDSSPNDILVFRKQ